MSNRGERKRRWIVLALASVLSCAVAAATGKWMARAVGSAAGQALAEASEELRRSELDPEAYSGPTIAELAELGGAGAIDLPRGYVERAALPSAPVSQPSPAAQSRMGTVVRKEVVVPPALGILVRASAVRDAIARGGRPSGAAVEASGERPAGLILQGVSSYGTALRDGDLLTRVGGTAATSESRVVAAVSGAIRSGAKAIDGEIWRAGRRVPFVVEIPRRKRSRRAF